MSGIDGMNQLFRRLPRALGEALRMLGREELENLEEIRLYAGAQPELVIAGARRRLAVQVGMDELLAALSAQALYSCERQMAEGYIPLEGGHRAGVCGRMACQMDGTWRMTDVSSVCIRLSHRVPEASLPVRPFLLDGQGGVRRVLVLGAPGSGKTTLLRDAAVWLAQMGVHVAVADEREELFAGNGQSGHIHVLSGMDKARAFALLLRAMAPQAIISDEIGAGADVQAVLDVVRCGVGLLVSAHAHSMEEAKRRPAIRQMIRQQAFDWYILLGRRAGVKGIYDCRGKQWEENGHGRLGYGGDGHDRHQCIGLSALGR